MSGEIHKDLRDDANGKIKLLKEKYDRMDEKFKVSRRLEKCTEPGKYDNSIKPNKNRQHRVRFAFIMFKHCLTNDVALGIFKQESLSSKFLRFIFRVERKKG